MKNLLDDSHKEYFIENQILEVEALLSESQIESLNTATQVTTHRRRAGEDLLDSHCRDLWRESEGIVSVIRGKSAGQLAALLSGSRPLRVAFDHLMRFSEKESAEDFPFRNAFFFSGERVSDLVCVQGITCILLVCLKAPRQPSQDLPNEPGSCLFLHPDHALNLSCAPSDLVGGVYYSVGYAKPVSLCVFREKDPLREKWIELGYAFGDRLLDGVNPVVVK